MTLRARTGNPESGGIVTGWLVRVIVVLAVVGVLGIEVGSIVIARLSAADTAAKAAEEAGFRYRDSGDLRAAEDSAREKAEAEGTTFVRLVIDNVENTATVTIRKRAKTLFTHRIDPLRKYTRITSTQTAPIGT